MSVFLNDTDGASAVAYRHACRAYEIVQLMYHWIAYERVDGLFL
jgi:hypothetical protein